MLDLIAIIGPTASGKTTLAVALAKRIGTEIISADSRQLYRGMDIGTGKDLAEYTIDGTTIPYHLIDICPAGYRYNLFEYVRDFNIVYADMMARGKQPLLCGGTGLYVETILKGYSLPPVPENSALRQSLQDKSLDQLAEILRGYKTLHNTTDIDTCKRAIRAIEIAEFYSRQEPELLEPRPMKNPLIVGVNIDRELRRAKITRRLHQRLEEGMVEEVKQLLDSGIDPESLIYYGLEYKFLTEYIIGRTTYNEMVERLEIAIHQFAKRQMTWFRGMERRGHTIRWIDASMPTNEKVDIIESWIKEHNQ
ncbi:MAG: tRNA (adenosine(37)-N6)-dimethylallyltransferase MiaA [Bacteroidaceae bacterium]|nr:tRNA (adenosine(37)-N6)-dimethylallyltransferase MiaA [Bacteroidaceae bacterium]MBQ2978694.1 tRNA (adenosine(37)-N6)-dimethylallyltransferase MiaA [Bacteroidaceae bacterium]